MNTYIALLRGINMGGKNKLKMAELRTALATLNFENVSTYIQSGNIVFQSSKKNVDAIAKSIKTLLQTSFDLEIPVIVRSKQTFLKEKEQNPFIKADANVDISQLYHTYLEKKPTTFDPEMLQKINVKEDKYQIIDQCIYLYFPNGYSQTKLTNALWEKKLQITATTRNWKTVCKISEMLSND